MNPKKKKIEFLFCQYGQKLTFPGDGGKLISELFSPDKNKWQLLYLPSSLDKRFASLLSQVFP